MDQQSIIIATVSAVIAGSISMAAGEYVSVSSQSDIEYSDIQKEKDELKNFPSEELEELQHIYISRGLSEELAKQVAIELTKKDALKAHLRDELGISSKNSARPVKASIISALTFLAGAIPPFIILLIFNLEDLVRFQLIITTTFLAILGALAARIGGANMPKGAIRVALFGALAMILTNQVSKFFI